MIEDEKPARYLGDGLYARTEGTMIELYTDRTEGTHYVYLEPEVFEALLQFAIKIGWLKDGQVLKGNR